MRFNHFIFFSINCLTSCSSSSLLEWTRPCLNIQDELSLNISNSGHLVSLKLVFWKDVSKYLRCEVAPLVGNHRVTVTVGLKKEVKNRKNHFLISNTPRLSFQTFKKLWSTFTSWLFCKLFKLKIWLTPVLYNSNFGKSQTLAYNYLEEGHVSVGNTAWVHVCELFMERQPAAESNAASELVLCIEADVERECSALTEPSQDDVGGGNTRTDLRLYQRQNVLGSNFDSSLVLGPVGVESF